MSNLLRCNGTLCTKDYTNQCGIRSTETFYTCTRPKGHTGNHIACAVYSGMHNYCCWEDNYKGDSMSNAVEVTGIIIKTETGEEIKLSIEAAKQLYNSLHVLFGDKIIIPTIPSVPIVVEPWRYPTWPDITYLPIRSQRWVEVTSTSIGLGIHQ